MSKPKLVENSMPPRSAPSANAEESAENATHYNLEKFKYFLITHVLPSLYNKSGILVLGPMGAGKSTAIGVQLGAVYQKKKMGRGYELTFSRTYTPQTSDGFTSKTFNVGVYVDKERDLTYLDTAGLFENRGKEEALWTTNNLGLLLSILKELKVVIVVNYAILVAQRDDGLRRLVVELSKITQGDEIFYPSIVFLITNGYDQGRQITVEDFLRDMAIMLAEMKVKKTEFLQDLARRYPLSRVTRAARVVAHVVGESAQEEISFDIDRASPQDKAFLCELQQAEALLEALLHYKRVVFSYPDGSSACQKLRNELIAQLDAAPLITQRQLLEIKARYITDTSLEFLGVLASLCASYLPSFRQVAELMTRLFQVLQGKDALFQAIANNWRAAKEDLTRDKENKIRDKTLEINKKQEELDKLSRSLKPVLYKEEHIVKERNSGFLGVRYLVGKSRASYQFEYNGIRFFNYCIDYDYSGGNAKFTQNILVNSPDKGKLEIEFTSNNGEDLNVKVKVLVCEKDLPATRERIETLKEDIAAIKKELEILSQELSYLNAAQTAQQLEQTVTAETKNLQEALAREMTYFKKPLDERHPETEWDVTKKLKVLFDLLHKIGPIRADLAPVVRQNIEDFLRYSQTIDEKFRHSHFQRLITGLIPQDSPAEQYSEAIAPRNPYGLFTVPVTISARVLKELQEMPFSATFLRHQFETGVSTMLFGLLFFLNIELLPTCAMVAGTFITCAYIRMTAENVLANMRRVTEANTHRLSLLFKDAIENVNEEVKRTGMTGREAIERITEKVNVDIRADLRADLRTLIDASVFRL